MATSTTISQSQKLNKKKGKNSFSLKSEGNSMFPILQHGDLVEYIRCNPTHIKENDIILTNTNGTFVTHRVIYKTATTYITRGDNNPKADLPIQANQIFGKAIRFKRRGVWYGIQEIYLQQSILYLHEINKLAKTLSQNTVPHVFLKGVLISLRYENTIPRRIYADCDILVKRENAQQIELIFKFLGYKNVDKNFRLTTKKNKYDYPEISFVKNIGKIPVVFDVHFEPVFLMTQIAGMNLLYDKQLLYDLGGMIINNRKSIQVKGMDFFMCAPTDQALYLVLHIFHHNCIDSVRYSLLNSVILKSKSSLFWKKLRLTIKKFHLEGYSYLPFLILKRYYKTPIPPSFISSIVPSWSKKKISWFLLQKTNIFNNDSRFKAGIERFILIFVLSPSPIWKKIWVFFHKDTIQTILSLIRKIGANSFKQGARY